jgi:hypothetical protein
MTLLQRMYEASPLSAMKRTDKLARAREQLNKARMRGDVAKMKHCQSALSKKTLKRG